MTTYYLPINPEPWAVGPLGVGRKGGKHYPYMGPNLKLKSFQEEVKAWFEGRRVRQFDEEVTLRFYFWRRLDRYRNPSGREVLAHASDATNMQKSTEDALQGILFKNDSQVKYVASAVMEQNEHTKPGVGILIMPHHDYEVYTPGNLSTERMNQDLVRPVETNAWPPGNASML